MKGGIPAIRKRVSSPRRDRRIFSSTSSGTKAVNLPQYNFRGGRRL